MLRDGLEFPRDRLRAESSSLCLTGKAGFYEADCKEHVPKRWMVDDRDKGQC